jgi:hypothetical protein
MYRTVISSESYDKLDVAISTPVDLSGCSRHANLGSKIPALPIHLGSVMNSSEFENCHTLLIILIIFSLMEEPFISNNLTATLNPKEANVSKHGISVPISNHSFNILFTHYQFADMTRISER